MPSLTLLTVSPEAHLEFPVTASPGGLSSSRLRLSNTSATLVAYKVKSTAPKLFVIKPSTGSIRKGESVEVQIVRKPAEGEDPVASLNAGKRPDRFLIQAAIVDTEEKKLLLHAAHRGKAQGAAKFWDGVPKDVLEEQQLEAVLVEGREGQNLDIDPALGAELAAASGSAMAGAVPIAAAADGARAMPKTLPKAKAGPPSGLSPQMVPGNPYAGGGHVPSNEDIDAIIGKMSLPGRAPAVGDMVGYTPPVEDAFVQAPVPMPTREPLALKKKEVSRRKEDTVLQKHSRPVTYVTLDPTGKILYTCGKDKMVLGWTIPEGECVKTFEGHRGAVWSCSVSHDGQYLLSCGADNMILLWDANTSGQLTEMQLPGVARCVEWAPATGPHGGSFRRCVACSNSFKDRPAAIHLIDFWSQNGEPAGGRPLLTIEGPTLPSNATQVAWAGADGSVIASVHVEGAVYFWHSGTGALLSRLEAQEGPCSMVCFPRDRSLMATCGRDDLTVKLWDLGAGVGSGQVKLLMSHKSDRPLNAVALRPSLSRSEVLSAMTGCPRGTCDALIGGGQDARDVALKGEGGDDQFDPIPLRMAVGAEFAPWQMPGQEEPRGKGGGGHFGPIHTLAFSLDAGLCISAAEDGNIRVRELTAGSPQPDNGQAQSVAAATAAAMAAAAQQQQQQLQQREQQAAAAAAQQQAAAAAVAAAQHAAAQQQAAAREAAQAAQAARSQAQHQARPLSSLLGDAAGQEGQRQRMIAFVDFDPSAITWPPGAQQEPLPLRRGQEIEVLYDFGGGWAFGRVVSEPQRVGLFPTSYALPLAVYAAKVQEFAAAAKVQEAERAKSQQAVSQGVGGGLGPRAGRAAPAAEAVAAAGGYAAGLGGGAPLSAVAAAGGLGGIGLGNGIGASIGGGAGGGAAAVGHTGGGLLPQAAGLPDPAINGGDVVEEETEGDCSQS